jgi:hypothetical protein
MILIFPELLGPSRPITSPRAIEEGLWQAGALVRRIPGRAVPG